MNIERLRVLKPKPEQVSYWKQPPAWIAPGLSLCAVVISLISTVVAIKGLSSYARQNLHAHQITACSNLMASSHMLVLNVSRQCVSEGGSIDCNPVIGFMPSSTPKSITGTHPTMLALSKYLDDIAAVDLVVPGETQRLGKLSESAKGLVLMYLDPAGTTVIDDATTIFTNLNAAIFKSCKSLINGSGR